MKLILAISILNLQITLLETRTSFQQKMRRHCGILEFLSGNLLYGILG